MDALKQQLLKVQQQLAGLSASQKMLTASLLVIMVMTLFYWSKVAGTSELTPVIDSNLAPEELANVKSILDDRGIEYVMRDNRVMVAIGKRGAVDSAMAQLGLDNKLPAAYTAKMAEPAEPSFNIMEGESGRQQRLQAKRQQVVEHMIRQWDGVKNAQVIIAGERHTGILSAEKPTASVSIRYDGSKSNVKKLVQAARAQVARAQPGLDEKDVTITVNGLNVDVDGEDSAFSDDEKLIELANNEEYFIKKILRVVDIPGTKATVSVNVKNDDVYLDEHKADPKGTATAIKTQSSSTEENSAPAAAAEPGATANMGMMADTPAASAKGSSVEKTEQTNENLFSFSHRYTKQRAGYGPPESASVFLPESFFRKVWKGKNPKATADPSDADIQQVAASYIKKYQIALKAATKITDDKLATVETYFDFEPAPNAADAIAAAGLATLPVSTSFGAKEIAIGALAVISLFMVSMMVRKSAPPPVLAAAGVASGVAEHEEPIGRGMLTVNDLAGEVGEANLTLTGQELSEEAIEAKQVIEQVGSMVKENPDVAANLIKRWLNHA